MDESEVSLGAEVWFLILGVLRVFTMQLLDIALVCGLGEPALLIKQREDTHGTLDEIDGGLEIQSKVDEGPVDPFCLVLFLQHDKSIYNDNKTSTACKNNLLVYLCKYLTVDTCTQY